MSWAKVPAALMAALSQEVQPFLRRVQARRVREAPLPAWEFPLRAGTGILALSGVGQAAAARAADFLVRRYQPQAIISLGFGGAVTPELPPGALVVGETLWRYDPDSGALEELQTPPSPVALGDVVKRLTVDGLPAFPGSVVTTPHIIHKAGQGSPLTHLLHPVLDLETGAAAAALGLQNIPFLALRAVTDTWKEEIPGFISRAVREGKMVTAATALTWLAADPRRLAALINLWRRSRLAAHRLARALEVILEAL
jgi:adenosylhomocysteine nucleosidase